MGFKGWMAEAAALKAEIAEEEAAELARLAAAKVSNAMSFAARARAAREALA